MNRSDRILGALAGYLLGGSISLQKQWSEVLSSVSIQIPEVGVCTAEPGYISSRIELGWFIISVLSDNPEISPEQLWSQIFSWGRQTRKIGQISVHPNLRGTEKKLILESKSLKAQKLILDELMVEAEATPGSKLLCGSEAFPRALAFSFRFDADTLEAQIAKTHPYSRETDSGYLIGTLLQQFLYGMTWNSAQSKLSEWAASTRVKAMLAQQGTEWTPSRYPNALETFHLILDHLGSDWMESIQTAFVSSPKSVSEVVCSCVGMLNGAQLGFEQMIKDQRILDNLKIVIDPDRSQTIPSHLPEGLRFLGVAKGLGVSAELLQKHFPEVIEVETVPEPERETVSEPELEVETVPELEEVPESKTEEVPEPEVDEVDEVPESEEVLEPENEIIPELEEVPESKTEEVPEPELESEEVLEPEILPEPELESEEVLEPEVEIVLEPEILPEPELKNEEVPEPEVDEVPELESEIIPEPEVEITPEPEVEEVSTPEMDQIYSTQPPKLDLLQDSSELVQTLEKISENLGQLNRTLTGFNPPPGYVLVPVNQLQTETALSYAQDSCSIM